MFPKLPSLSKRAAIAFLSKKQVPRVNYTEKLFKKTLTLQKNGGCQKDGVEPKS